MTFLKLGYLSSRQTLAAGLHDFKREHGRRKEKKNSGVAEMLTSETQK